MFRYLSLIALVACGGSSKEDSGSNASGDATDTTDSADATDTADSGDGDGDSDPGIPLRVTYSDGLTGLGIAGAEVCTVIPESDDPCQTTDSDGVLESTWEVTEFTNVLNRLTHPNYITTLYTGRYEQDVQDGWTTGLENADAIEIGFVAFSPSTIDVYLSTGGVVAEAGQGLAVYWLVSGDGSALDGAVVSLENDAGEAVGQVVYQSESGTSLDAALTATSTSGVVAIANVPPGTYTFEVTHDTLTCIPGFAFASDVPNVTTVPIEADSQTMGNMFCFAG